MALLCGYPALATFFGQKLLKYVECYLNLQHINILKIRRKHIACKLTRKLIIERAIENCLTLIFSRS